MISEMGLTVILRSNNPHERMSALDPMSALPPKADIGTQSRNVRFVPKADSCTAAKNYCSITLSASERTDSGMVNPSAFAVLRLMTNSYFVGYWIGSSPGLAPLRTRSMYSAA